MTPTPVPLDLTETAGDNSPIRRRMTIQGFPVAIEFPAGSTKMGEDDQGNSWARVYLLDYGFIEGGPNSIDGETMDVYVGPHHDALQVFVVNQLKADGSLDEHKCLLGFSNEEEALNGYLRHYPEGWGENRIGETRTMGVAEFGEWLKGPGVTKAAKLKTATPQQQETQEFKSWFGASVVKDTSGQPLRVTDTTPRGFGPDPSHSASWCGFHRNPARQGGGQGGQRCWRG